MSAKIYSLGAGATLAALVAAGFILLRLWFFPLLPIDETRYLSVAWEMWQNHNWLVPQLNGEPYAHKPPLLFWLINVNWLCFGVTDFTSRVVIPVVGLSSFFLLSSIVNNFFANAARIAALAPMMLLSFLPWLVYSPLTMFDVLVCVCLLASLYCMLKYGQEQTTGWLLAAGLAVGAGLLAKGPVMLVFWLPLVLSHHFWKPAPDLCSKTWVKAALLATLLGILVVLLWAIPAAIFGGETYAEAILWRQTTGRIANAFAHARPWYWYLLLLPLLLLPWSLTGIWRGAWAKTPLQRFALWGMLPQLLLFSLMSGKQVHYLIPLLPFAALWMACKWPDIRPRYYGMVALLLVIALSLVVLPEVTAHYFPGASLSPWVRALSLLPLALALLLTTRPNTRWLLLAFPLALQSLLLGISPVIRHYYDLQVFAREVIGVQEQGKPIAYVDDYADQFRFLARGTQALTELRTEHDIERWIEQHPEGYLVLEHKAPGGDLARYAQLAMPYRNGEYLLIRNSRWQEMEVKTALF
ncbi:glycosyltransferase family 39 protein [Shewanella sp. AS16]|uniref:ArnT family glycosyltransferase n=1 Tax=Shewanella sp. AS16 TaxID=2907625 RepID=UPI001F1E1646|nr:glycosyltransferase family 39 protein [Shewanella sp. AS16]MCE9687484.1 glycosyltransferase family 39 protein [Shewanella sp. AS16]